MADFDESLPSHSVFVPHFHMSQTSDRVSSSDTDGRNRSRTSSGDERAKKPFLKKGSRQEPSALARAKAVTGGVVAKAPPMQHHQQEDVNSDHGFVSTNQQLYSSVDMNESVVSSSSFLLADTSASELQRRYLREKEQNDLELDEFEMIERELDNIAVTPLLSSVDGNFPVAHTSAGKQNLPASANTGSKSRTLHGHPAPPAHSPTGSAPPIGTSMHRSGYDDELLFLGGDKKDEDTGRHTQFDRYGLQNPSHSRGDLNSSAVYNLEDDLSNYTEASVDCASGQSGRHPHPSSAHSSRHGLETLHRKLKGHGLNSASRGGSRGGLRESDESAVSRRSEYGGSDGGSARRGVVGRVGSDGNRYVSGMLSDKYGDYAEEESVADDEDGYESDDVHHQDEFEEYNGRNDSDGDTMRSDDGEDVEHGQTMENIIDSHDAQISHRDHHHSYDDADGDVSESESALLSTTTLVVIPRADAPKFSRQVTEPSYGADTSSLDYADDDGDVDDAHGWSSDGNPIPSSVHRSTGGESSGKGFSEQQQHPAHKYNFSRGSQHSVGAIGRDDSESEDQWALRKSCSSVPSRGGVVASRSGAGPAIRPSSAGSTRRSQAPGVGRRSAGSGPSKASPRGQSQDRGGITADVLAQKAKELDEEIETYRKENSQLKSVRKQQEVTLAESQQQRSQLAAWIAEEKKKTEKWCEDTKEAALRERRAAAKHARDIRNNATSGPTRKERAEIDALHASIEKLKADHELAQKRWKTNTNRLQQKNKEQADLITDLQKQVTQLELEKLHQSVKAPTAAVAAVGGRRRRVSHDDINASPDSSYMEEIDIDDSGNVILQSTKSSRVQISSHRDPSLSDSQHPQQKQKQQLSQRLLVPPESSKNADRHENSRTSRTHVTANGGQKLSESDSHNSIVEFGTVQAVNLAYEEETDRRWQVYSMGSNTYGEAASQAHGGSGGPMWTSNGDAVGGRQSASLIGDNHSVDAAVVPVREYTTSQGNLHDDEGTEGSYSPGRKYDPRKYNVGASTDSGRFLMDKPTESESGPNGMEVMVGSNVGSHQPQHALNDTDTTFLSSTHGSNDVRPNSHSQFASSRSSGTFGDGPENKFSRNTATFRSEGHRMPLAIEQSTSPDVGRPPRKSHRSDPVGSCRTGNVGNEDIGKAADRKPDDTIRRSKDRTVRIAQDGAKVTTYGNGTVKTSFPDGSSEVHFANGDVKKQNPLDGSVTYYYAHAKTTHITYADDTEVYEFPNGQYERHFPTGKKVITFPDGTIKTVHPDGYQESVFPDGVVVKESPGGGKEVSRI